MRILVVDDIHSNVALLEARLMAEGFEIITAYSGPECLAKMETNLPDIVLLDLMMPGMDGIEVCRRIKSDPKTAHTPVVIVTAAHPTAGKEASISAGADDFLVKPIDDAALLGCIRNLVSEK